MNFDMTKDNEGFYRRFRRVLMALHSLVFIYLVISIYAVLKSAPASMHNWRGIVCIVLTMVLFVVYSIPLILLYGQRWLLPLRYALSLWLILYLLVVLLSLINATFLWDFYIAFGMSFTLLRSRRLLLAVSIIALTLFAFQGLLAWPLQGDVLASIVGQTIAIFSMTAFCMVLQRMIGERYERNRLFQQLTQANAELEEAHRQLAQSVIQEQELAVLRERTRLAREMHDTLGHTLVLISVKLEAAQRLLARDPERCERELESTKEIARGSMTALRASIANLRSPALEHEHIYHALSRAARELAQRTDLHVTYTLQAGIENLPDPITETLWKVGQEVFTNIEKHARAKQVDLRIVQRDEKLLMSIHDDGIGLPQELCQLHEDGSIICMSPRGHYGLSGMLERVEGIGGHLSLRSSKEQGTTVEIELPLLHTHFLGDSYRTSL